MENTAKRKNNRKKEESIEYNKLIQSSTCERTIKQGQMVSNKIVFENIR